MAVTQVLGYNIGLEINGKTVLGRTEESFNVSATEKSSITKDDQGVKNTAITGHEITFSVSALLQADSSTSTTKLSSEAIIDLALKTGSDAVIPFVYKCAGRKSVKGNCVITSYSESSQADPENDATISLNLKTTGPVTTEAAK